MGRFLFLIIFFLSFTTSAEDFYFENQDRKNIWKETKDQMAQKAPELGQQENLLINNRKELNQFKLNLLQNMEETEKAHKKLEDTLDLAESRLQNPNEKHYEYLEDLVNPVWRNLVEESFKVLFSREFILNIPKTVVPSGEELNDVENKYIKETKELEQKIKVIAEKEFNDQIQEHHRLLLKSGKLRSLYFKALSEKGISSYSLLNGENWGDIKREITIIPYRWTAIFHTRTIEIRQHLNLGIIGYINLLKDIFALLILILTPFLTWLLIKKFTVLLDRVRENIVNKRLDQPNYKTMALWIQRANPFVPWLISLMAIEIADYILQGTTLVEFNLILPYFRYYVFYKIFRRSIVVTLTTLSTQGRVQISREARVKMTQSSKISALFIFIALALLHSFESVVSEGIVYNFIQKVFTTFGVMLLFSIAHKWRQEISESLKNLVGGKFSEKLAQSLAGRASLLLSFPSFLLVFFIITSNSLKKWGGEFDISKRVSAKFFRKKLENSEKLKDFDNFNLPDEYLQKFQLQVPDDEYLLHHFKESSLDFIKNEINEWLEEKSEEHSLALYGDSGVGKSTLLRLIELHYGNLNVIKATIPPKLTNAGQIKRFFGDLLGIQIENGETELIELDKKLPPTLIIVDNAHHMFLSQVGGFEGYSAFIEIINARTENIFWCASFNSHSWRYLNSVFGRNQYFRVVKKIAPWGESDIRELILSRHRKTNYTLSYDDILEAARSVDDHLDTAYIEIKFFRLLWEQSYGNPRRAISLWFSALKGARAQTLKVGLPSLISLPILNELSDDAHFVYTEILRHESLSTHEAVGVTNLAEGVVRHAIKIGLENDFLERDKRGRFSVCTVNQYNLVQFLKKKNFIYGN